MPATLIAEMPYSGQPTTPDHPDSLPSVAMSWCVRQVFHGLSSAGSSGTESGYVPLRVEPLVIGRPRAGLSGWQSLASESLPGHRKMTRAEAVQYKAFLRTRFAKE